MSADGRLSCAAVLRERPAREVKEAALFNVSTLRTQTSFRTPDGSSSASKVQQQPGVLPGLLHARLEL